MSFSKRSNVFGNVVLTANDYDTLFVNKAVAATVTLPDPLTMLGHRIGFINDGGTLLINGAVDGIGVPVCAYLIAGPSGWVTFSGTLTPSVIPRRPTRSVVDLTLTAFNGLPTFNVNLGGPIVTDDQGVGSIQGYRESGGVTKHTVQASNVLAFVAGRTYLMQSYIKPVGRTAFWVRQSSTGVSVVFDLDTNTGSPSEGGVTIGTINVYDMSDGWKCLEWEYTPVGSGTYSMEWGPAVGVNPTYAPDAAKGFVISAQIISHNA